MKIPHAEMVFLRMGRTRVITRPVAAPKPPAKKSKPPCAAGRVYKVTSREKLPEGEGWKDYEAEVTCEAVERDGDVWRISLVQWDRTDRVHLLKARPGGDDYTEIPAYAMVDEPEAVDAATLQRFSAAAALHEQIGYGRAAEIQAELDSIQLSIDRLLARGDLGKMDAKRLGDMKRSRVALQKSLAA